MFIDSHCHINFPELADNLDEVLANMRANQVSDALCVSVDLEKFPQILALAEQHDNIYASVGVHPDYELEAEPTQQELVRLAKHPKVIAIGETGLDYFARPAIWNGSASVPHPYAPRSEIRQAFDYTYTFCCRYPAPDAGRRRRQIGGAVHCFTESLMARRDE
jgi:TatD DNase family protein